eukprot:TRINITY_DN14719_c0_g1_i1.p1 TRINITY_DN14719_c0_g1~~TRINITY_DN14719_c0_g1_i1.p1  ORF type:complete len:336 (+),score=96.79 TRINITY_DN14719_c0_g1_i1:91-1008(+)
MSASPRGGGPAPRGGGRPAPAPTPPSPKGPRRPRWKPDSEADHCEECGGAFSFFNRRHHCRHCGGIFCRKCSGERRVLPPKMGHDSAQRVCGECREQLDEGRHGPLAAAPNADPALAAAAHAASVERLERRDSMLRQRKICVLGAALVGKSALCVQYVEESFSPYYQPTISNTFQRRTEYKGQPYLLSVLDTAGQDEVSFFLPQYSIGTHGYIMVFSVTDYHSFELVRSIYDKIQDCNVLDGCPLILVGNKKDLEEERQVSAEEAQLLAAQWGVPYHECSAKDPHSVEAAFGHVLAEICRFDGTR